MVWFILKFCASLHSPKGGGGGGLECFTNRSAISFLALKQCCHSLLLAALVGSLVALVALVQQTGFVLEVKPDECHVGLDGLFGLFHGGFGVGDILEDAANGDGAGAVLVQQQGDVGDVGCSGVEQGWCDGGRRGWP